MLRILLLVGSGYTVTVRNSELYIFIKNYLLLQDYYEPYGITYMGLQLLDVPQTNISIHFNDVADFIDLALDAGGKVLVNCEMGMSRSSTCVLAYLMFRHHMSADEALSMVSI